MGLDVTHDCWHGAYSAFMRWRCKLAEVAGLPPLRMMEGFYMKGEAGSDPFILMRHTDPEIADMNSQGLPIRWSCLKRDVLHPFLYHSDCDGYIAWRTCGKLADRLEQLLPLLPDEDAGGHIGNWRDKTQTFINGLRAAYEARERVEFH